MDRAPRQELRRADPDARAIAQLHGLVGQVDQVQPGGPGAAIIGTELLGEAEIDRGVGWLLLGISQAMSGS